MKVITLILFTLVLNISVGIMSNLPGFEKVRASYTSSESSYTGGLTYTTGYSNNMENELQTTVDPTTADKSGFTFSSVLDFFNLGFLQRTVRAIKTYTYGFNELALKPLFEEPIKSYSPALSTIIFGGINTIITILYAFGILWLWSNKDVLQ